MKACAGDSPEVYSQVVKVYVEVEVLSVERKDEITEQEFNSTPLSFNYKGLKSATVSAKVLLTVRNYKY